MATSSETTAVTSVSGHPALWEDFIDIFYAPSDVFARRQNGSFWIPLLVVTLSMGVIYFLTSGAMRPIVDAEFNRQTAAALRHNPQLNAAAIERFRPIASRIAQVVVFVSIPIIMLATGTAVWLVGKLFEATQTFRTSLVVAAYSCVPKIIEAVVNGVQALMLDSAQLNGPFRVSLGLGRFFDPDTTSPLLLVVLGRVNVFTLWVTVLLAIGLAVTGKIPRGRAMLAAAIIWILGGIPMFQALRNL
jgi:hypothetical protein